MARLIASGLERRIGRRVTVENRPGGTGAAAGEALKYGGADGTMVAFMPSPSLVAKLFAPSYPFDPATDLAPITTAGTYIDAFAVSPKIEARTVAEYVAWLKGGEAGRNKIGATASDAMLQYYTRALGREFGVPMEGQAFRGRRRGPHLVPRRPSRQSRAHPRDVGHQAGLGRAGSADGGGSRLPRPHHGGMVRLLRGGGHAAGPRRCLERRARRDAAGP